MLDHPTHTAGALDRARLIANQVRREKAGDMTGLLSGALEAAPDAAPRDEDDLGVTILGGGCDVPDEVVGVSGLSYDAADPGRASAEVTLHHTDPDAVLPSFDRSILVVFAREIGRWEIEMSACSTREVAGRIGRSA